MICPHCNQRIPDADIARHLAAKGGKSRSKAKLAAVAENAKKGGWPKGRPRKTRKLADSGGKTPAKGE